VTDKNRRFDFRVSQDRIDRAGVKVHCVRNLRLVALPVPRQIKRDDVKFRSEWRLARPESFVAAPAMHEHQRIFSGAVLGVMHLRAVQLGGMRGTGSWFREQLLREQ
jgi:hypothetical protein